MFFNPHGGAGAGSGRRQDMRLRVDAAKALMPYVHARLWPTERDNDPDTKPGFIVPAGLVPIPGIGPGTSPLPRECSATEPNGQIGAGKEARTLDLYLGKVSLYQLSYSRKNFGSSTWARTRDLRINSPALYQLSYRGTTLSLHILIKEVAGHCSDISNSKKQPLVSNHLRLLVWRSGRGSNPRPPA